MTTRGGLCLATSSSSSKRPREKPAVNRRFFANLLRNRSRCATLVASETCGLWPNLKECSAQAESVQSFTSLGDKPTQSRHLARIALSGEGLAILGIRPFRYSNNGHLLAAQSVTSLCWSSEHHRQCFWILCSALTLFSTPCFNGYEWPSSAFLFQTACPIHPDQQKEYVQP